MIFSSGAINGAEINAVAINGGGFRVPITAVGTAGAAGVDMLTVRRSIAGAGVSATAGVGLTTVRRSVASIGVGSAAGVARTTRRVRISAFDEAAGLGEAIVTPRILLRGRGDGTASGALRVRWRSLHQVIGRRRVLLTAEARRLRVIPQPRLVVVPQEPEAYVRQSRRSA